MPWAKVAGKIVAVMCIFLTMSFLTGCTACNVMLPSKSIKIKPYVIEYYRKDVLDKLAEDEDAVIDMWNKAGEDDKLQMEFRVEGSGIYYYRLLYRVVNSMDEKIKLYDHNIKLLDAATMAPIQQVKCFNWQMATANCNILEVYPKGKATKEIRFGYSVEEGFAPELIINMSGCRFMDGEINVDVYAKPRER